MLFDADRYPEVRAQLDLSLGKAELPDEIIVLDSFQGEAERWVTSQITASGAAATGPRAQLAAIYMTAALLAPNVPQIVSQKDATGESVSLKGYDPEQKEAQLKARAKEMIAMVNGGSIADLALKPSSAIRHMTSSVAILCPTHRTARSICGCGGTTLVF